jgi:hypothetical protein
MTSNVNESNRADIAGGKHETVINITSPHLSNMAQRAQPSSDSGVGGGGGVGGVGGINNSLKGYVEEDDADEHKPVKAPPRGSPLAAVLYIVTAVALVNEEKKKKTTKRRFFFFFFFA